jgi:hypothetical protein
MAILRRLAMKNTIVLAVGVAAVLVGCGGGGSSEVVMPTVAPVQFTALAKQVLVASADSSAPVEVGNLNIAFGDDENPQAFDDVLPPAP